MRAPTSMPCSSLPTRATTNEDITKYSKVCLAFSDTGAQNYVSVAGDAEVLNDRSMIRELWGIPAKAWWNSPDDPNIRLLKVIPLDAQCWDAPGATVAYKDGRCSTDRLKAEHGREPQSGDVNDRTEQTKHSWSAAASCDDAVSHINHRQCAGRRR